MSENTGLNDPDIRQCVDRVCQSTADMTIQHQNSLIEGLFYVNTGGIGGLLAYVATKGAPCAIIVALGCLFVGLISVLVLHLIMFRWLYKRFQKLSGKIAELANRTIEIPAFASWVQRRSNLNWIAVLCGCLSGVAFVVGSIFAAYGISTSSNASIVRDHVPPSSVCSQIEVHCDCKCQGHAVQPATVSGQEIKTQPAVQARSDQ